MSNDEISSIINSLEPKINKALYQTDYRHREDLSQGIKEKMVILLKSNKFHNTPGLFEFMQKTDL
ncbi:hypothetical protein [Domibacillus enclensis]|uniref:Uncharacterized protein n=1 Tax=Domibacillus enclensis TaxID=1017273 RepID=A0A1N7D157_9BACI|nr:hypothetical protein [Domibacillus enclensis]OXS72962.1 hypothetical protein B1B05_18975 [Domibacillus enclensis]SIR69583.1 hypothetical protein SAMN05443094_11912 [Domibacillus enclensis]